MPRIANGALAASAASSTRHIPNGSPRVRSSRNTLPYGSMTGMPISSAMRAGSRYGRRRGTPERGNALRLTQLRDRVVGHEEGRAARDRVLTRRQLKARAAFEVDGLPGPDPGAGLVGPHVRDLPVEPDEELAAGRRRRGPGPHAARRDADAGGPELDDVARWIARPKERDDIARRRAKARANEEGARGGLALGERPRVVGRDDPDPAEGLAAVSVRELAEDGGAVARRVDDLVEAAVRGGGARGRAVLLEAVDRAAAAPPRGPAGRRASGRPRRGGAGPGAVGHGASRGRGIRRVRRRARRRSRAAVGT